MLLRHGVRSALAYAKTRDLQQARALSNRDLAPHLEFVDLGGHGYSKVRLTGMSCVRNSCGYRGRSSAAPALMEDPCVIQSRMSQSFGGQARPQLVREVIQGDPGTGLNRLDSHIDRTLLVEIVCLLLLRALRRDDELCATAQTEFPVHMLERLLNRLFHNAEGLRNLAIRLSLQQQIKDLPLTAGQQALRLARRLRKGWRRSPWRRSALRRSPLRRSPPLRLSMNGDCNLDGSLPFGIGDFLFCKQPARSHLLKQDTNRFTERFRWLR